MSNNLTISLLVICILGFLFILWAVKKKKMLFKHALLWWFLDIVLIILIFIPGILRFIADLMGIETISNMIFLFGFIIILGIILLLTMLVAEQKAQITTLSQEVGILENKVRGLENGNHKKTNR